MLPGQPYILAVAAMLGTTMHHALFIHGEWHLRGPAVLIAHAGGVALALAVLPPRATAGAVCAYTVALFGSVAAYRLFFHRTRHFPGPALARITKFGHVWSCRDRRNFRVLDAARQRYGDFVRTGPNEICVFRPQAIDLFERAGLRKSEWYDVLQPKTSAVFERDEHAHAVRRRLWSQAMSSRAIRQYLPRILSQVEQLASVVGAAGGQPVKVNDAMAWFAFDSMGEFMFNESFGMMTTSTWHPAIVQQRNALALLGVLAESIWVVRLGFAFVPWFGLVREWLQMVAFCDAQMDRRIKSGSKEPDIAGWFIEEFNKNKAGLDEQQRRNVLSGNTITAMVAGSDTTRPSLVAVWYVLALYPDHAHKVYRELETADVQDIAVLAGLQHFNAVINEALRLYPAAMTGASRLTPEEGLWVDETWIPGGVKVAAPRYSIMRLPTAFERPDEFIPERWYSRPELILEKKAFAPFGAGNKQCIGRGLAMTEIRLVTASLLQKFSVTFAPGHDPEAFERDMRDQVTCQPGDCWLCFSPR